MNKNIEDIKKIAMECTKSESDGYSKILSICNAMDKNRHTACLGYVSEEGIKNPQFD